MKISDIKVGTRFKHLNDKFIHIIEVDRVMVDDVLYHVVKSANACMEDEYYNMSITVLIRNYDLFAEAEQTKSTTKRKAKRTFMQARRSSSVIEVKKISNGQATIVNVDEHRKPIAGTERKVERNSLVKSYTPIAK